VLPTRALECFGLIVLEAYACGLPVVATDVGAIPESVAPVAPGFLVPPDDPHALGAKLGEFLDGRAVPVVGEPLADYVRRKYSEDTVLEQYERMYQAVFDG
jgi:glycosyltransferase involved in cell wall biosynthesis